MGGGGSGEGEESHTKVKKSEHSVTALDRKC